MKGSRTSTKVPGEAISTGSSDLMSPVVEKTTLKPVGSSTCFVVMQTLLDLQSELRASPRKPILFCLYMSLRSRLGRHLQITASSLYVYPDPLSTKSKPLAPFA